MNKTLKYQFKEHQLFDHIFLKLRRVKYNPNFSDMNNMTDAFNNMVIAEPQPYIASPQPTLISQAAPAIYSPPTIYTASPVMQSQPMCVPIRYDGVMQQHHEDQKVTHAASGTSDIVSFFHYSEHLNLGNIRRTMRGK